MNQDKELKEAIAKRRVPEQQERDHEEMMALIQRVNEQNEGNEKKAHPYSVEDGSLTYTSTKIVRDRHGNESVKYTPHTLCNFNAWIDAESVHDNGIEQRRYFTISGKLHNRVKLPPLDVEAKDFASLAWVAQWGSKAIVNVGPYRKDHIRAAIQYLSPMVRASTIYTHLGWRCIGDTWLYLHAGGALGAHGLRSDIEVLPGDSRLNHYSLPNPPQGDELVEAIRAVLDLIPDVDGHAPESVIYPELAKVFRAPLCELMPAECSDFSTGQTGVRKTAIAALFQAFYGADFDSETLPGSWTSTENALERIGHAAKDVLFTIDDFVPKGSTLQVQRMHDKADRVIRGHANKAGRQRMRPDGSIAPQYYSRGLIATTGEEVPTGESLRGRMLIHEIKEDDIDLDWLTDAQERAREGVYARVMAAFIQWLAPQMERLKKEDTIRRAQNAKRDTYAQELRHGNARVHARTATNIAEYSTGFEWFIDFAVDVGAIDEARGAELKTTCASVMEDVAYLQAGYIRTEEPTKQFILLLRAAITGGYAHVCDVGTNNAPLDPHDPSMLGWIEGRPSADKDGYAAETWRPRGQCIGWCDEAMLYLNGVLAYGAAQRVARDQGTSLPLQRTTLWSRLADKNVITSENGQTTINKKVNGKSTRVRVMPLSILEDAE